MFHLVNTQILGLVYVSGLLAVCQSSYVHAEYGAHLKSRLSIRVDHREFSYMMRRLSNQLLRHANGGVCEDVHPLQNLSICTEVLCTVCASEDLKQTNVTCVEPRSEKSYSYTGDRNATQTLFRGIDGLFQTFTVGYDDETKTYVPDCACGMLNDLIESRNCRLTAGICTYFNLSQSTTYGYGISEVASASSRVRLRAIAWDSSSPTKYSGRSRGWIDPTEGFPVDTGADVVAVQYDAAIDAVRDLRLKNPARACNPPHVPPMVIVPGFTSTNIEFKLDNAPPPKDLAWCNTSTHGMWKPLFPMDPSVTAHPLQYPCWDSDLSLVFHPDSNTFSPLRSGECKTGERYSR